MLIIIDFLFCFKRVCFRCIILVFLVSLELKQKWFTKAGKVIELGEIYKCKKTH